MKNIVRIVTDARQLWPLYVGIILGAIITTATALLSPFLIAYATEMVVDMTTGARAVETAPWCGWPWACWW